MEYQACRLPFELLSREFRLIQKRVEKEVQELIDQAQHETNPDQIQAILDRIGTLKTEVNNSYDRQAEYLTRIFKRHQYNKKGGTYSLDILMADHLSQHGYQKTAQAILATVSPEQRDLVDLEALDEIHDAVLDIQHKSLEKPLAWAKDNASRLRRFSSPLEFELRKQEFIEAVRRGERDVALNIANQYFATAATQGASNAQSTTAQTSNHASSNVLSSVQQVMGVLAFSDPVHCGVSDVEQLFQSERWSELEKLFRQEAGKVLGLGEVSSLIRLIASGIIALKTMECKSRLEQQQNHTQDVSNQMNNQNTEAQSIQRALQHAGQEDPSMKEIEVAPPANHCPVCACKYFRAYASTLPMAKRTTSHLICAASGQVMGYNNPPFAFPNGYVYCAKAIRYLTSDDGTKVFCLHTGQVFEKSELKRLYIV